MGEKKVNIVKLVAAAGAVEQRTALFASRRLRPELHTAAQGEGRSSAQSGARCGRRYNARSPSPAVSNYTLHYGRRERLAALRGEALHFASFALRFAWAGEVAGNVGTPKGTASAVY